MATSGTEHLPESGRHHLIASAGIDNAGCCNSALLLQGKLASSPICGICLDVLLAINEESLEELEVVAWKSCGHLYHRSCIEEAFGTFPRATTHNKEAEEGEEPDYKKLCPHCPMCKAQDDACIASLDFQKYCDPVMRVFLASSPGTEEVSPVTITVDGEDKARFDLAHVASKLGTDMKVLKDLIDDEGDEYQAGVIDTTTRIQKEQLNTLIKNLMKLKSEGILSDKINELRRTVTATVNPIAEILQLRKDNASLEKENAKLKADKVGLDKDIVALEASAIDREGALRESEDLCRHRGETIKKLETELGQLKWERAEVIRVMASEKATRGLLETIPKPTGIRDNDGASSVERETDKSPVIQLSIDSRVESRITVQSTTIVHGDRANGSGIYGQSESRPLNIRLLGNGGTFEISVDGKGHFDIQEQDDTPRKKRKASATEVASAPSNKRKKGSHGSRSG